MGGSYMKDKIIVPKKRGDDGYKVTSIRIPDELFNRLNEFTAKTELSRNEVLITLLSQALDIAEIKDDK
jgi:Ribbon-helix-helix protein, copG family.